MAISLANLRTVKADKPARIVIYGPPKMGKTTLASEFPDAVFIQTEDGASGDLALNSFGLIADFEGVMEALGSLYAETHTFKTVVIDSLSELERLVFAEICRRNKWSSIESPGWGVGYREADYIWQEVIDGLNALRRDRGMMAVLVAHATIDRFNDPSSQSYSRYDIDLHSRARAMVEREVDAILLVKQEVSLVKEDQGFKKERAVGQGGDARWIYCQGRPAYIAGNRFNMPDKVLFQRGAGYAQIAPFFPQPPQAAAQPAQAAA